MRKRKTLIISDIHGRYQELLRVLDYSQYNDGDRLIFLGDNIDRGPDSKKVMDYLIALVKKDKKHVFLMGNHEEMILHMLNGDVTTLPIWLEDAEGRVCMRSYGIDPDNLRQKGAFYSYILQDKGRFIDALDISLPDDLKRFIRLIFPKEHLQLMRFMRTQIELGDYHISHGGPASSLPLNKQRAEDFIWGEASMLQDNKTDFGKICIFGHWHMRTPAVGYKKIALAVYGRVAAMNLETLNIADSDGTIYNIYRQQLLG